MIYFGTLIGIFLTSGLCYKKKKIKLIKKIPSTNLYIFLWGIVLICLVAFRSTAIGNDTGMYEYIYNSMARTSSYSSWVLTNTYTSGIEHGFYFLCFICSKFINYRCFLILTALFTVGTWIYIIGKYSENIPLSLFLYICFPYYTFCMSGLRQAYALAFIAFAYIFVKKKKVIWFLAMCLLACLFHSSALLFIPVYWIDKLKNNKKTRTIAIVSLIICIIFRNQIWNIATIFARQQYSGNDGGGVNMCIFLLLSAILGIYYRKSFLDKPDAESNKTLFYLQILAAMIAPLALINSAVSRIYFYYHIFFILYVPTLIKSISRKNEKMLITAGFIIVAIYFLSSIVMNPEQHYYPYYFM